MFGKLIYNYHDYRNDEYLNFKLRCTAIGHFKHGVVLFACMFQMFQTWIGLYFLLGLDKILMHANSNFFFSSVNVENGFRIKFLITCIFELLVWVNVRMSFQT